MNKSLLALAIAGALAASAAAHAETTLYGSARLSVDRVDPDADNRASNWDVVNNASRLGVRGSEDLGGGLSAIYQYEFGVRADGTQPNQDSPLSERHSWVGLKGGFGSATIGRQWTPYYDAIGGVTDVFNQSLSNPYSQTTVRQSNSLKYITPDFSGFSASAMVVADGATLKVAPSGATEETNNVDMYQIALQYQNGPLGLGAAWSSMIDGRLNSDSNEFEDADLWGVSASYTFASVFKLSAIYEDGNFGAVTGTRNATVDTLKTNGQKDYGLVGEYTIGNGIVRAGWGRRELDDELNVFGEKFKDNDFWAVGYQHNLSKRTRLWAEYADNEGRAANLADTGDTVVEQGENRFSLGMRHDF